MKKTQNQDKITILQQKIKDINKADFLTEELFTIEKEKLKKQIAIEITRKNKNIIPYIRIYRG